jgi:hypothetical protein
LNFATPLRAQGVSGCYRTAETLCGFHALQRMRFVALNLDLQLVLSWEDPCCGRVTGHSTRQSPLLPEPAAAGGGSAHAEQTDTVRRVAEPRRNRGPPDGGFPRSGERVGARGEYPSTKTNARESGERLAVYGDLAWQRLWRGKVFLRSLRAEGR